MADDHGSDFSRRRLLQAAGGVTFLALSPRAMTSPAPLEAPLYEPPAGDGPMPLFTALPYLQGGPSASRLVEGDESMVIAWQTDGVKADYELRFGDQIAGLTVGERVIGSKSEADRRQNHVATLSGMKLGTRYSYSLKMNGERVLDGYFTTRKPRGHAIRFVSFGDNSYGEISDRQIAYQAYRAKPDFVMNTGDNVYESGLDNEYMRYFFPVYNADVAGPRIGAPLLRSVPFYTVIANHDVHGKDANGMPCGDLNKDADALAYFTNMHHPLNGPDSRTPTGLVANAARKAAFEKLCAGRFPKMANYSYDMGDVHFTCLDSNTYVDPTDPALQKWIAEDLDGTDARWKFVVYHHPAYNVGDEHYAEQQMRALSPLLEAHGVDIALHGHEHTYQRTKPLRFEPIDLSGAKDIGSGQRLVPGKFKVDTKFDGKTVTKPDGILYITTGAGGKHLYDPTMNMQPSAWLHEEDLNVAYVERFVSDRHSISVFDVDHDKVRMTQVDEWGRKVDEFVVTKA